MTSLTGARLKLATAALLFSTGGAAIKSSSFTSWQIAGLRSGIAALAIFALVPASRRGWTWRTPLVAVAYGATLVLFVLANKLTTSANTIFLQSTAPLYLLLLAPWLLKESIRQRDVWFMTVVGVGLAMFFVGGDRPAATAPNPFLGNILAAVTGVTWALTVTGLRWIAAREGGGSAGAAAAVVCGNLFAFLVTLPMALPLANPGAGDWAIVIYLGVFQIGLAYIFVTTAIRHIPVLEASVILLIEPALNPVWSWLVHGERPGAWALAGGVLIIAATGLKSVVEARREAVPAASS